MKENNEGVHDLLRELRDKLENVTSPEERDRLGNLVNDIEGRLTAHLNEDHHQEVIEELRDEVIQFEARHPDAAATIHNLINMLSSLGL
jgi:hypothetical protein